jgi:long-subunit fatty acid transport protein
MSSKIRVSLAVLFCIISVTFVSAQSNDEGLPFLQLNFLNPGARSLAMGGAFLGMADDATASLANPAGLVILTKPEVSLEFSATNYQNQVGWHSGTQTIEAERTATQLRFFNARNNLTAQDFPATLKSISFASFVYPVIKDRFVLSGFYNQQTDFERNYTTTPVGLVVDKVNGLPCATGCTSNYFATDSSLDLTIRNIGVSAGFKPFPQLSLGATLNISKLSLDHTTTRLDLLKQFRQDGGPLNIQALNGDSTKASVSLGALIKPVESFSLGVVYSRRPEFDLTSSYVAVLVPGSENVQSQKFKVPDSFGFGVSYRFSESFAVNFDIDRILYSQLNDGYYNAFFSPIVGPDSKLFNQRDFEKSSLEVDDGTEYRLGGEYLTAIGSYPFAIRAGYWREPFHSINATQDDASIEQIIDLNGNQLNDAIPFPWFSRALRKDYNHVSFGTGLVLTRFTIDWAYDYSKNFKRFILSTDLYF